MNIPGWWSFTLLALGAFRVWRLLAADTVLDGPRQWAVRLGWNWNEGDPIPSGYREKAALFINCSWCFGFWVALAWWGLWQVWPHATEVVSVPLALSAVVGLVSGNLDPPEE